MKFGLSLARAIRRCGPSSPSAPMSWVSNPSGSPSIWCCPVTMAGSPHHGDEHPPIPPQMPVFDAALNYLSFLAGQTENIRFGTQVYHIACAIVRQRQGRGHPRHRVVGRFEFGVGASWLREEWDAVGLDFRTRGSRVDEALAICRALWTEADRRPITGSSRLRRGDVRA